LAFRVTTVPDHYAGENLQVSTDLSAAPTGLRRRLVTAACMMSAFMVAIEVTIVATAMPTIVAQLGNFGWFTWVFAAYILTSAVTAPVYGRLADLYGRKRAYYVGASLFLIGSALCGFASSMGWLIAFRTLQGLGAGALQPLTITILGDIYHGEARARPGVAVGRVGTRRHCRSDRRRVHCRALVVVDHILGQCADRYRHAGHARFVVP
jgi:Na+/melibiose symporter-like transporter